MIDHHYKPLVYKTPADAARVVAELLTFAHRSKTVTVATLHELSGVNGHYSDHKWGWTEKEIQSSFDIKDVEDGFELVLAEPKYFETVEERIDRLHGPGAAAALDEAIANGSIFK